MSKNTTTSKAAKNGEPSSNGKSDVGAGGRVTGPGTVTPDKTREESPSFYFEKEKGQYWRQNGNGEFVATDEKNLKRHFKRSGFDVNRFSNNGLTEFELELCRAQDETAVDKVIALAGHKAGVFITQSGRKFLVPYGPKLIAPRPGETTNFQSFLVELLGPKQLPWVLSWLKLAVEDLRTLNPKAWHHSQLLALAGQPDCGKSFFQTLVTMLLGGRKSDPYLWMVGKSNFNDDLAESEHLMMEDKQPFRDAKSRNDFAAKIKQLTVSSETPVHGKNKKQFVAPCYRRMTLTLNNDPDSITILPMLSPGVTDKMILVNCSKANMLPDYPENLARFERELPAFIHYLLSDFDIPENIRSTRFGVTYFLNPDLVEMLQDYEPHLRLLEVIDGTFFANGQTEPVKMQPGEIQMRLKDGPLGDLARQLITYSSALGQLLARLALQNPSRFRSGKSNGQRRWTINPPEK